MRRLFRSEPPAGVGLDVGALAPMVDMMTLLLVFLLRTYSTEPAPRPPEGEFALAGTTSVDPRSPAVEILVSAEAVWIDGRRVIATPYLPEDGLVREVYDPLLLIRDRRRVEVFADRAVPYGALRKVLASARAAGFEEVALVAVTEAGM